MKHTFFVLLALFMIIGATNAQDVPPQQDKNKSELQTKDRVFQEDHLRFINGMVFKSHQGQLTVIQEGVRLQNGLTVNPDGTFQMENQKHRHLRDGECLDMNGNRYMSLTDFNKNRMMGKPKAKDTSKRK